MMEKSGAACMFLKDSGLAVGSLATGLNAYHKGLGISSKSQGLSHGGYKYSKNQQLFVHPKLSVVPRLAEYFSDVTIQLPRQPEKERTRNQLKGIT